MEVNINKPLIRERLVQSPVPLENIVPVEQFSLILDQTVGDVQTETAAADQPPAPDTPPQTRLAQQAELDEIFNFARPLSVFTRSAAPEAPKNSAPAAGSQKETAAEIDADAETQEPQAAPGGLIQAQLQTTAEKIVQRGAGLDVLERLEAKPLPKAPSAAGLDFAEIYAQAQQAMRMHQDGQLVKFKFALEPAELGKLDIYVFAARENLQIAFASGEEARKILQTARPELQAILDEFGYSLADLDFSGYSGARHQELENQFLAQNTGKNEQDVLKIVNKKDIIAGVRYLLQSILVNYLA